MLHLDTFSRWLQGIFLILLAFGWAAGNHAEAQVERAFSERAGFNVQGDIEMIGNALLTCDPLDSDCADVQDGSDTSEGNNDFNMVYVNIDPGANFDNSSSADLSLPPGATVLYAGLYWGARAGQNDPDRGTIQFRVPGSGSYQAITADQLDTITSQGNFSNRPYMAFADVTSLVQSASNGTYFAGDITANVNDDDLYGGWSLIVLYEDTTQPFRRLALFDGAAAVTGTTTVSTTVSGLLTPLNGNFDTFMGALVWEGDVQLTGDQFRLEGNNLSDGLNPSTNFWNSSVSRQETRISAKNPDYVNQLAVDVDYIDASNILANGATDAEITFVTDGDFYYPHALTFAVDLFVPNLVDAFTKDAVDVNGGDLLPGDVIEYTIGFENTGLDGATNVVLADPIPAFASYVPSSLVIDDNVGTTPGPQSDQAGDDLAEFDAGNDRVVFRLGDGADENDGGLVLPAETAQVRFQVQVDDDVNVSGETIHNVATVNYNSQTLPLLEFEGDAEADLVVADLADLSVEKTVDNPTPPIGTDVVFTVDVTNNGPADATGVEVVDQLPSGYTFVSATTTQGSYDDGTGVWTVGSLSDGATATLEITATVLETGDYLNTTSVTGNEEDPDEENNEDDEEPEPVAEPELTLEKTADPTSYSQVGDEIEYSFTVENTGNVTLENVSVDDPLLGGTVVCTPATLGPGDVASCGPVNYTVTQTDIDNGEIVNTATGLGTDPDGDPVEDEDEATVQGPTPDPALTVVKDLTNAPDPIEVGSVLEYTITATNTGNVTLTDVVVDDPMLTPNSETCTTLAPNDDCVLVGTYTVTQADVDNGEIINTGTATGEDPDGDLVEDEDEETTEIDQEPELLVTKDADPTTYSEVGDIIEYSFTVENVGNVTIDNVSVDDPLLGGTVVCTPATLGPGDVASCGPANYTVTQTDVDNGEIVNTATGSGTDPDGDPVEDEDGTTVTADQTPDLTVDKVLTDAPDPIEVGSVLEYTITATNTGNVTLTNVVVDDPMLMPSSETCATLAPNDDCVLVGTYTVTQADVDNGEIINTGTATGEDPNGDPVEDEDEETTEVDQTPELLLVKSADPTVYSEAGETIDYSFTVENTGNVTLENVTVTDPLLGGAVACTPTTLVPGDVASCGPVSYTVTQTDIDNGEIVNTATGSGTDPDGDPVEDEDGTTVTADQTPDLTVDKALTDAPDPIEVGSVLEYTITATNTGNVTLTNVVVDDPMLMPNSETCTTLVPGADCVLVGTYTVTQADVDNGEIINTGTATGEDPDGDPVEDEDEETTEVDQAPELLLVKSADPTVYSEAGEAIEYSFTVENVGNVTIENVSVDDPLLGGTVACTPAMLGPGETASCGPVNYTVTQTDIDNGEIVNTATGSGTDPDGDPVEDEDEATVTADQTPELLLTKNADPTTYTTVGQTIDYSFTVENTGNVTIENVSVDDPLLGGAVACTPTTLVPGDVASCGPVSYTVTQTDIDNGEIVNTATGSGTDPDGNPVEDEDETTVTADQTPDLTVDKALTDAPDPIEVGSVLEYTITATNTGNVTLTNVVVDDPMLMPNSETCTTLVPGADCVLVGTYTVTQADVDNGEIINTGTATGEDPDGDPVEDEDEETTEVDQAPELLLVKSADPTVYSEVGETIEYSFTVENTGNVTIDNVSVDDPLLGGTVTCTPAMLGPGETASCGPVNYTVTQTDIDNGEIVNTATASGEDSDGDPVEDEDETTVTADQMPELLLTKNADPTVYSEAGETIEYSFTVENVGNVTLENVSVDDPLLGGTVTCTPTTLGPGGTADCGPVDYTVTQADVDNGEIVNTATGSGTDPDGNPVEDEDETTVTADQTPDLTVDKALTDAPDPIEVGSVLEYTITATNTGNVTLTNVEVSDNLVTPSNTTCPSVAPGDNCVLVGTYTVTQTDVDNGEIINTGTATGEDPNGDPVEDEDEETTEVDQAPELLLVKSADPTVYSEAGEAIEYSFMVENVGNVTIDNVSVDDPLLGGTVACTPAMLGPGETASCGPVNYTVTQTDIDNGEIVNTATGSGTDPDGDPVEDEDETTVTANQTPDLTVDKALTNAPDPIEVGSELEYTITATNTGNVTLTNVIVSDNLITPSSTTCASVSPGDNCVLVGTYTVTQADVDNGEILNTGTATGEDPDGDPVEDEDDETTPVDQTPELTTLKELTDAPDPIVVGSVLEYTVTTTNTGNVSLTNVVVSDDLITPDSNTCPTVAPGEDCVLVGNYTVTQDDVDNGEILNTGTGTGEDPDGDPVEDEDDETTDIDQTPDLTVDKALTNAPDPIVAGSELEYTVTATNTGNVTLTNVVVSDNLITPSSTTCASASPGDNCVLVGTYTVTQDDVDNGEINNTGTATGEDPDGNPVEDDDEVTTSVPVADLSVVKTVDDPTPDVGETVIFTLVVTNNGSSDATGVEAVDQLPSGYAFVNANASQGSYDSGSGLWTVGTLTNGATATLEITATVLADGEYTNTVTVTGNEEDPDPDNNEDSETPDPNSIADISITKTLETEGPYTVDQEVTYSLVVSNAGPSPATNIEVMDTPENLTIVEVSGSGCTEFPCTIPGPLVADASTTITVIATIDGSGAFDNVATVEGEEDDPDPDDNTDNDGDEADPVADVSLVKDLVTEGPYVAGQEVVYTLTVSNAGPSSATNIEVTDTPTNLTFTEVSGACSELPCTIPGPLAAGESTVITVTAMIDAPGAFDNAATAVPSEEDPTPDDNTDDEDNGGTAEAPDLRVTKRADNLVVQAGGFVPYTITIDNFGEVPVTGVQIVDQPAPGLSYVEGSFQISDMDDAGLVEGLIPLTFGEIDVPAGGQAVISYVMRIGATALPGELPNTAVAMRDDEVVSNEATETVVLEGDPLMEETRIFGSVFRDHDGDGWQDDATARDLQVRGGFSPNVYIAGSTTIDRGNGPEPVPDASVPLLSGIDLGELPGLRSPAESADSRRIVISQRLRAAEFTDDFELTTAEGTRLTMNADGRQVRDEHGKVQRGTSSQVMRVDRVVHERDDGTVQVDYIITNTGFDDWGLPGARLATPEGLVIETDAFGRYHIEAVDAGSWRRGRNYVVKLDKSSLPRDIRVSTENPQVRRITEGIPVRFDFGVQWPADVSVSVDLETEGPYEAGQEVDFAVVVRNDGPSPATKIRLEETLQNLTIASISGAHECTSLPCTIQEPLVPGGSRRYDVKTVISDNGPFGLTAEANAQQGDPDPRNNSANAGH